MTTSSANPSPGSDAESILASTSVMDNGAHIDIFGDDDGSDILRLGFSKEIDGGEASYYSVDNNAGGWKWDEPMSTLDWAISDH